MCGDIDEARTQVLSESLGLGVATCVLRDTPAEQTVDDDVDSMQVGQVMHIDAQESGLRQEYADPVGGEPLSELGIRRIAVRHACRDPLSDVGCASLVAAARTGHTPQRDSHRFTSVGRT